VRMDADVTETRNSWFEIQNLNDKKVLSFELKQFQTRTVLVIIVPNNYFKQWRSQDFSIRGFFELTFQQ